MFAEPGSTAKMVLTGHAFVVDDIWIGGICAKRELRLYAECKFHYKSYDITSFVDKIIRND